MRYVIFPSANHLNGTRPPLASFFENTNIQIVFGPTESGLYLIEADIADSEILKISSEPFYIMFEDFESPLIH